MGIAKVTRNFQVTIPRDIRRMQGIDIGDTVFFVVEDDKVDFFKMSKEEIINDAAGIWKSKIQGDSLQYVKKVREEWVKREKRVRK